MSSCIKNPCKICKNPVNAKTGIKCGGTCSSWVHYSCLNYTPGKIKDIKAGIIKVTCPCPDCKTTFPKEYRTDQEPFTCKSSQCPARRPPTCDNEQCPMNEIKRLKKARNPAPCPLDTCGARCKDHSIIQVPDAGAIRYIGKPCIENLPPPPPIPLIRPVSSPDPRQPLRIIYPRPLKSIPVNYKFSMSSIDKTEDDSDCLQSKSSEDFTPPSFNAKRKTSPTSCPHVSELCNTVGQLTYQINDLMDRMKELMPTKEKACLPLNQSNHSHSMMKVPLKTISSRHSSTLACSAVTTVEQGTSIIYSESDDFISNDEISSHLESDNYVAPCFCIASRHSQI